MGLQQPAQPAIIPNKHPYITYNIPTLKGPLAPAPITQDEEDIEEVDPRRSTRFQKTSNFQNRQGPASISHDALYNVLDNALLNQMPATVSNCL